MLSFIRISLAFFFALQLSGAYSQDKSLMQKYSDSVSIYYNKGNYCGNQNRLAMNDIIKIKPFDSIQSIKLVSFKLHPVFNGKFDLKRTHQSISLEGELKNKLIDVLVNYNEGVQDSEQIVFCYSPHNAVAFLNDRNEVIGYLILCFDCTTSFERWNAPFFLGFNCQEKWHLLKLIFGAAGITYAISEKAKETDYYEPSAPNKIYNFVEISAEPIQGRDNYLKWLSKQLKYPKSALENKREGKVYVKFIIEPDGSLSNPEILKGLDPECDREALRIIKLSPKWKPGKQGGKSVRSYYTQAITFKLPEKK